MFLALAEKWVMASSEIKYNKMKEEVVLNIEIVAVFVQNYAWNWKVENFWSGKEEDAMEDNGDWFYLWIPKSDELWEWNKMRVQIDKVGIKGKKGRKRKGRNDCFQKTKDLEMGQCARFRSLNIVPTYLIIHTFLNIHVTLAEIVSQ